MEVAAFRDPWLQPGQPAVPGCANMARTLHQTLRQLPLDAAILDGARHNFMTRNSDTATLFDHLNSSGALVDIGILATLGCLSNGDPVKTAHAVADNVLKQAKVPAGTRQIQATAIDKLINDHSPDSPVRHVSRRERHMARSLLVKQLVVSYPAARYIATYLRRPTTIPTASDIISPLKRTVEAGAAVIVAERSLRGKGERHQLSKDQMDAWGDTIGSTDELDGFIALARLINRRHLPVWLLPTGSILEHGRKTGQHQQPGLDYLMVAPRHEQVYGVQIKSQVRDCSELEDYANTLVLDGTMDLGNSSMGKHRPGTLETAAHLKYFGENIDNLRVYAKHDKIGNQTIELADFHIGGPVTQQAAEKTLRTIDDQVEERVRAFAPELFEAA